MRGSIIALVFACAGCRGLLGIEEPIAIDAPGSGDAQPDSVDAFGGRVRQGLIAQWTFNETTGVTIADTSGSVVPGIAAAQLRASDVVTWSNGTMTVGVMTPAIVAASLVPPDVGNPTPTKLLNQACVNNQGVTLEAWVKPAAANQGTMTTPSVVAGIGATVLSRNIAILQAGTSWMARVRTTPDSNGGPDLIPLNPMLAGVMTHLVLVADATVRALYVNGDKVVESAPGVPLLWDDSFRITLANELSLNRPWIGTFALVALYHRALTANEIRLNLLAGPDAQ